MPDNTLIAEIQETTPVDHVEIAVLEARLATRLDSHEAHLAELKAGLEAVRRGQAELRAGVAALEQRSTSHLSAQEDLIADLETGMQEQLGALASSLKPLITAVEQSVAAQLHGFEEGLRAQAHTLECMKLAMSQTDDLIERVVDAFDSLQGSLLTHSVDGNG